MNRSTATQAFDVSTLEDERPDGKEWHPAAAADRLGTIGLDDSAVELPFEHFELDVLRIGSGSGRRNGNQLSDSTLAQAIVESGQSRRRIRTIVTHCCSDAFQEKIAEGAAVLAQVPHLILEFIEQSDRGCFEPDGDPRLAGAEPIDWHDRAWLYTATLALVQDQRMRARSIGFLRLWLFDGDPSVREFAASALGSVEAHEAVADLERSLGCESSSAVREMIEAALDEIADA